MHTWHFQLGSLTHELIMVAVGLPVHHPERTDAALSLIRTLCADSLPQRAFLAGDGAVLFPLCEELKVLGVPESAVRIECYFNNPVRKAP